jgi:hypothetical protein
MIKVFHYFYMLHNCIKIVTKPHDVCCDNIHEMLQYFSGHFPQVVFFSVYRCCIIDLKM